MPVQTVCSACGARDQVADSYQGMSIPCKACGQMVNVPALYAAGPGGAIAAKKPGGMSALAILLIVAVVAIFFLLACGGILLALLLPAIQSARVAALRAQSASHAHELVVALHDYETEHGTFPPSYVADETGKPLYSWRVLVLPYLDQQELYDQFDLKSAWDSPTNRPLADRMPTVFHSPQEPATDPLNETSYLLMAGEGTIFAGGKAPKSEDLKRGSHTTIAVVEVHDSGVIWTQPTDLDAAQLDFLIHKVEEGKRGQLTTRTQGVNVGMFDGSTMNIKSGTAPAAIREMTRFE